MPLLLISSAPLLLKTLFCITAQATYLCWSHFEVFCQHEPIMKLKVNKRPGIRWGKHCTLEREGSRMPHHIPSFQMCLVCVFLFGNRDAVKLQSTPHSQQDTICQYLSHSKSLKHYWSQRIQSPRFLASFEIALIFFLAILVNLTYIHAHAYLCRHTDIFPEHEIQKREQKHRFLPLSCHFQTKKKKKIELHKLFIFQLYFLSFTLCQEQSIKD